MDLSRRRSSHRSLIALLGAGALVLLWLAGPGSTAAFAAAPVCNDASYTVESGAELEVPIVGTCTDDDGDPMSAQAVSFPQHGTLTPGPNGGGLYRSQVGYVGPDSFTFRVNAGGEQSNIATVSIDVIPGSAGNVEPPQCFDNFAGGPNTQPISVGHSCFDPDTATDQLTFTVVDPPQHGSLGGSFNQGLGEYNADPGFSGTDSFTYRASDGEHESNLATITINVIAVPEGNQPPTCPTTNAYVQPGDSVVLAANCIDPDGDPLSYLLAPPFVTGGSLQIVSGSSVRYTPHATTPVGFVDELGYTAKDPYHNAVPFIAKITVTSEDEDTYETAPEATPEQPFVASVQSPNPGPVYIDTRAVTEIMAAQ